LDLGDDGFGLGCLERAIATLAIRFGELSEDPLQDINWNCNRSQVRVSSIDSAEKSASVILRIDTAIVIQAEDGRGAIEPVFANYCWLLVCGGRGSFGARWGLPLLN
jgi:hypothetical protein